MDKKGLWKLIDIFPYSVHIWEYTDHRNSHILRIAMCVWCKNLKTIEKVTGIFKRNLSDIYDAAFVQKLLTVKSKKASSIIGVWEGSKYAFKGILLV